MKQTIKQKYISSAFILLTATIVVKVISAVYKIPLTGYIGAVGRGYFSVAYNLCMPIHALTMGAFPLALTRLVSRYEAKGDRLKIKALRPPDLYFHLHSVYNEAERGIFLQALPVNILQDIGANVKDCW